VSQDLQMTAKEGIPPGTDKKHAEFKGEARPPAVLWHELNSLFALYSERAEVFRKELEEIKAGKK
jgi:hypothetical protein